MRQSWSDDRLDELQLEMRNGFVRLEKQIQQETEQVEKRIDQVDLRIEQVDLRIQQVDKQIEQMDTRLERLETRVDFGFGRLDGRMDSQARATVYFGGVLSMIIATLLASHFFG